MRGVSNKHCLLTFFILSIFESPLKAGFTVLCLHYIFKLFSTNSDVIEVTQTGGGDTQSGPRAKKRRLESGWAAVRDFITTAGQTVKLIPWYVLTDFWTPES